MRCQRLECLGNIPDELDVRAVAIVEIGWQNINMDELAWACPVPVGGWVFDRVVADTDDQIGGLQKPIRRLVGQLPDPPPQILENTAPYRPSPPQTSPH